MASRDPLRLLLLGRPDCRLCEEFEVDLVAHPRFAGLQLQHGDVDADADRQRRYGLRIPVLLDGWDAVICEGRFDAEAFDAWFRETRRSR